MALTVAQLADMQGDLGITDDETVFTDVELDRLYTRANSAYALAVSYGYRQLLANASKFFDYSAGMTKVSRSQIRDHVKDLADMWTAEARSSVQVRIVGALDVPPRDKDAPSV